MKSPKELSLVINQLQETIRFADFDLKSNRQPFELELGSVDASLETEEKELIDILLEFIATADSALIDKAGLWVVENPGSEEISRNLCLVDPSTLTMYTIGGIGLVKLDKESATLFLESPVLDKSYHSYQSKHGHNPGGTIYFDEKGQKERNNDTPLGVLYYDKGPYNLLSKLESTQALKEQGFNTPIYCASGRILNIAQGQYGFSIYKTDLCPDFTLNLKLYLDDSFNFKAHLQPYLEQKYQQLGKLHQQLNKVHGQPTLTNTELMISASDDKAFKSSFILKDLATIRDIPKSKVKSIVEGPCPQDSGLVVSKTPGVAAIVNDLQIALTQEFNILLIVVARIDKPEVQMQFLQHQYPRLMAVICAAYGLNDDAEINKVVNFSFTHFINTLKRGGSFSQCNSILGGLSAHAILGLSKRYAQEIDVRPR